MSRIRAPRLDAEERRAHIKAATLPLIAKHGLDVRTKQVAEAAGIAEGTIFKVFNSLAELLDETIADALSTDSMVIEIQQLAPDLDLETLVKAMTEILHQGLLARRELIAMIPHPAKQTGQRACPARGHEAARHALHEAIRDRLAVHESELRVPLDLASTALVALPFAALHPMSSYQQLDPEAIVDLCLHGIGRC